MHFLLPLRRPHVVILLLALLGITLFLSPRVNPYPFIRHHLRPPPHDYKTELRIRRLRDYCDTPSSAGGPLDEFERVYGRNNLRLTRAYEGSHERMRRFLKKTLRGEKVTVSAIGGSVTWGHGVYGNEIWFYKLGEWLDGFFGQGVEVVKVNGAAPATGSDYFSMCFPLHIPPETDLVLVELAVNDEGLPEHYENMENLIKGLLEMPNGPAVMLVEVIAFSSGGMGGAGGRIHLPVAQYYDIPVINQRHPLASHFALHPELIWYYFSHNYWGEPDTRHVNSRGHRDLAMLIASFIKDTSCLMVSEPEFDVMNVHTVSYRDEFTDLRPINEEFDQPPQEMAAEEDRNLEMLEFGLPSQVKTWRQDPQEPNPVGRLMPGMFPSSDEYTTLPRLKFLEGWNSDVSRTNPSWHPTCLSARSPYPQFNITPSESHGWEYWIHPDYLDKPYLFASQPGARFKFEVETVVGIIKIYALRSRAFNLGIIECWLDGEQRNSVEIDGYWDSDINIGRFTTLGTGLLSGRHTVECQLLNKTSDPSGVGNDFRMIALMSV